MCIRRNGWRSPLTCRRFTSACRTVLLLPPGPPLEVAPAINAIQRGNRLVTPIGGGVTMQPTLALDPGNVIADEEGSIAAAREGSIELPADGWWWD